MTSRNPKGAAECLWEICSCRRLNGCGSNASCRVDTLEKYFAGRANGVRGRPFKRDRVFRLCLTIGLVLYHGTEVVTPGVGSW